MKTQMLRVIGHYPCDLCEGCEPRIWPQPGMERTVNFYWKRRGSPASNEESGMRPRGASLLWNG